MKLNTGEFLELAHNHNFICIEYQRLEKNAKLKCSEFSMSEIRKIKMQHKWYFTDNRNVEWISDTFVNSNWSKRTTFS